MRPAVILHSAPGHTASASGEEIAAVNRPYVLSWIHGRVRANSCRANSGHVSGLPRLSPSPAPQGWRATRIHTAASGVLR